MQKSKSQETEQPKAEQQNTVFQQAKYHGAKRVDSSANESASIELREQLYQAFPAMGNLLAGQVSYQSQGHVLLIGPEDRCRLACQYLTDATSVTILVNQTSTLGEHDVLARAMQVSQAAAVYYGAVLQVKGHLGHFKVDTEYQQQRVTLPELATQRHYFDLLIDLADTAVVAQSLLPPGYFYYGDDMTAVQQLGQSLSDYIGEFEKPRYVTVDADKCAHARNDLIGCRRCLDVCAADAISSHNFTIHIDSHLCHGSGDCASVCPTSAIGYDFPTSLSLQTQLRQIISQYYQQAKVKPHVIFHDGRVHPIDLKYLAPHVLPFTVEEIGACAIEHFLAALAWGATNVTVICRGSQDGTVLQQHVNLANSLLMHMGYGTCVEITSEDDFGQHVAVQFEPQVSQDKTGQATSIADVAIARFEPMNKPLLFYAAIDHLNTFAKQCRDVLALRGNLSSSSYGKIDVNTLDCTMCMACVSACPTSALQADSDQPILRFKEQACVQCSLCQQSCPEDVISLHSQVNFDAEMRNSEAVLNEDKPFHCIRCGSAFATTTMIERMMQTLASHSAFANNPQRLQMCADCRVEDMVIDVINDPQKQLR
ncbi:4Fe-4S dicluster domain-containing protein [Thalassotalea maritima]|uniref:4Fe-4S dicluster domain-containing protein n=1 Tax=Thalassotalea maritima TaxID=3242416 RepID=UPI0035298559